jgi:hypothetical protein
MFHLDLHKDVKADYIPANFPLNISDYGGERSRDNGAVGLFLSIRHVSMRPQNGDVK